MEDYTASRRARIVDLELSEELAKWKLAGKGHGSNGIDMADVVLVGCRLSRFCSACSRPWSSITAS